MLQRARALFARRFGVPARFGASAPGRVNLIGEHTDYNNGWVLPMALEQRTLALAALEASGPSTVWMPDVGELVEIDLTSSASAPQAGGARMIVGVVEQFRRRGRGLASNIRLLITSDVPRGAGLASSAALEVAMATLIEHIQGSTLPVVEKAVLCQQAEHESVGVPCGMMDMLSSTMGQAGHAMLIDCSNLEIKQIALPLTTQASWVVIDSGVTHALATGQYAACRALCESAAKRLSVPTLREATPCMLDAGDLPDAERRAARHVLTENVRTLEAARALQQGDLECLGRLMQESHASLRDDMGVSCAELDEIVDAATSLRSHGVYGARMTGGGFGGAVVMLCRADMAEAAMSSVADRFAAGYGRRPCMFIACASAGAAIVETDDAKRNLKAGDRT